MPVEQDAPEVALEFVDLLYAVPVVDLVARISASDLHHVRASGWTDVSVALAAITFGWVGHHTNRQKLPHALRTLRNAERPFTQIRFLQFLIEIAIIGAYFALGVRAVLPNHQGVGSPDEFWKGGCLVLIFFLYLVWDGLDILITRRQIVKAAVSEDRQELEKWEVRARRGAWVTFLFLLIFGLFLAVGWTGATHKLRSVVVFDLLAILVLYLYRVVQECSLAGS